jgi:Sulfotransferase family
MTREHAPFFVVGVDRSGTTMLRLVLDRGNVAIPPESMFLADLDGVRRNGDLSDPAAAAAFVRRVWEHPRVRLWGVGGDPPRVPAGLSHADAYRFAVEAPFLAYARAQGKERWADKTPRYLASIDELAAVWPAARFVVLVRDGRDVALSLLRVTFGPNNIWAAARAWSRGVRLGLEAERRHPGRVLTARYEDVVAAPETEVERICHFLDLSYDREMLAIERTDRGKVLTDQAGWFTNIWTGINASAVGKWKTELSARDRAVFAALAGPELERMGYELTPPARPSRLAEAAYRAHDAGLRAANFVRLRLVAERGREVRYVLRRKLDGARRPAARGRA